MDLSPDMTWVRGAILIAMIIGFLGMWAWAWSKKRKPEFDRMAQLPLEEDAARVPARRKEEE
jgi:cytochrome c oxidase cbb3-type subunit 4